MAQPFTGFGTNSPDTASFSSLLSSLQFDVSTSQPLTQTSETSSTEISSIETSNTATAVVPSSTANPTTPSMISSSQLPSSMTTASAIPGSTVAVSTTSSGVSSATNTASNTGGNSQSAQGCHSVSCSSGLQAAIAVPVVVVVLGVAALLVFLVRRRRRRKVAVDKTGVQEKAKKGSRLSGSDGIHSAQSSQRELEISHGAAYPSARSPDENALTYRDVAGVSQIPSMSQTEQAPSHISRSISPVSPVSSVDQARHRPQGNPAIVIENAHDPFSDSSSPTSPNATSPFGDTSRHDKLSDSHLPVRRDSLAVRDRQVDDASSVGGSDTGSIREAQVGRHISVASGGRIANVRLGNQSPAASTGHISE